MGANNQAKSWSFWDYLNKLRPNSWKSDPQLNQKANRKTSNFYVPYTSPNTNMSKSTDWTDAALHVPLTPLHLPNPRLSLIFSTDTSTPTPPPRMHKRGLRERLESVAKSGLQAFRQPVVEPPCVKRLVQPTAPRDHDCALHHRNALNARHSENKMHNAKTEAKRRKNLSVVSLPNYAELKLSAVACEEVDGAPPTSAKPGRLDACMTRCRSFGSLLQVRSKLRAKQVSEAESDDSFGGLEEWDLGLIEHYNPKEASLPRPQRKGSVQAQVESLIVAEEEEVKAPVAPVRKTESQVKRVNRDTENKMEDKSHKASPPPSPAMQKPLERKILPAESGPVEHSSLMRILEEFSIRDKRQGGEFKERLALVEEFLRKEQLNVTNFGGGVQT